MIYRSGQLNQYLAERMLRTRDIEVIVDLTFEDLPNEPGQRAELAAAEKLGIQHHRFPLRGWGTGKIEHYVGAVEQIDRAVRQGKPVLVHCTAGAQRTGGVLAVYRLLIEGAHPQEVMREMQQYGWDPVDDEFMLGFLNDNMREFARRLKEKGVIEQIPVPLPRLIP
jgi:protein tyrosine/serine phosphatase